MSFMFNPCSPCCENCSYSGIVYNQTKFNTPLNNVQIYLLDTSTGEVCYYGNPVTTNMHWYASGNPAISNYVNIYYGQPDTSYISFVGKQSNRFVAWFNTLSPPPSGISGLNGVVGESALSTAVTNNGLTSIFVNDIELPKEYLWHNNQTMPLSLQSIQYSSTGLYYNWASQFSWTNSCYLPPVDYPAFAGFNTGDQSGYSETNGAIIDIDCGSAASGICTDTLNTLFAKIQFNQTTSDLLSSFLSNEVTTQLTYYASGVWYGNIPGTGIVFCARRHVGSCVLFMYPNVIFNNTIDFTTYINNYNNLLNFTYQDNYIPNPGLFGYLFRGLFINYNCTEDGYCYPFYNMNPYIVPAFINYGMTSVVARVGPYPDKRVIACAPQTTNDTLYINLTTANIYYKGALFSTVNINKTYPLEALFNSHNTFPFGTNYYYNGSISIGSVNLPNYLYSNCSRNMSMVLNVIYIALPNSCMYACGHKMSGYMSGVCSPGSIVIGFTTNQSFWNVLPSNQINCNPLQLTGNVVLGYVGGPTTEAENYNISINFIVTE